jgi:hypothetical protein
MEPNLEHPSALPPKPLFLLKRNQQQTTQAASPVAPATGVTAPLAQPLPPHSWPRVFPGL